MSSIKQLRKTHYIVAIGNLNIYYIIYVHMFFYSDVIRKYIENEFCAKRRNIGNNFYFFAIEELNKKYHLYRSILSSIIFIVSVRVT